MNGSARNRKHRRDWGFTVDTVVGSLLLAALGVLIIVAGRFIIDFTCWFHGTEAQCEVVNPLGATLVGIGIVVTVLGPVLVVRRPR